MKVVVIYNSQTGFTKRYAQWIAEAAGAECVELREQKSAPLMTMMLLSLEDGLVRAV